MSKKLIAVASASALALTLLVGVAPASATPTINYTADGSAGTSADPYEAQVPYLNSIVVTTNALHIDVTDIGPGDSATVSIAGEAKVTTDVHAVSSLVKVTSLGASSATTTLGVGDSDANFYVYGTSTAAQSVITITVTKTASGTTSTTTATKYFKPLVGPLHHVKNISAPATMTPGVATEVTFNITDVFGNVIETAGIAGVLDTSAGTLTDDGRASWDSTRKVHVTKIAAASTSPFILTVNAAGSEATNTGLGAGSLKGQTAVVNNTTPAAVSAEVAALTAQIATMRPKATSVTKKRFNTLARKWNAAFPSQKVKLKK
jgi:hypothetical protein